MDSNSSRSSISSPVMNSSVISDKDHQILSAKYTKLAAEYSKVRAQLGVLKKAVLEEQSKNVTVSEEMKHKEQMIRKSEAEMDSLNFRNQQLTRRVEILQEDLDRKASDASSGSRKKASISDNNAAHSGGTHNKVVSGHFHRDTERVSASESLNSVMGEELQLKIAENAKLHAALHGVDKRYEDMIGGLQSRIKELEATISKHAQAERADDTRLKELVHGLKIENADLTSEIKRLEHNLDDEKEKVVILQVQLDSESKSNKSEKYDTIENSSKESSSYLSLINELNDNLDNVKKQSDNLNERLKKSEQDKEHWKVEYQLVQMKHDKLKKQMDAGPNCDATELDLGIIISEDKRIYENRISELVADRLMADSKATNFYLECIALQKRIKFREKNKLKIEKELQNAQDRISNLHEGIGSTNSNYEEQISMLSEHVANMNEKLAEKTEEIQKLQFDLNQKRHKGGKR